MPEVVFPTYDQMMQPTIDALRALNGKASNQEIYEYIVRQQQLPPEIVKLPHGNNGRMTEVEYRLMWTRTYLKHVGLIVNHERGTWELTDEGWSIEQLDTKNIVRTVNTKLKAKRQALRDDLDEDAAEIVEMKPVSPSIQSVEQISPTPLYPTYENVRYFLQILDSVSYIQYRDMYNDIWSQRGNPQEQVDWANPDEWIAERLTGPSRELAERIWHQSKRSLNPRHIRGSWYLCAKHDLLTRDAYDILHIAEHGQQFIGQENSQLVAEIDAYEGLLIVLRIVAEKGPGRRSDLLPDYENYCLSNTTVKSDNVVKSYLYARLQNLIDRNLISRRAQRYEITDDGLAYLDQYATLIPGPIVTSEKQSDIRKLAKAMREEARNQLRNYLLEMDAFKFEELIQLLLEEMGYDNVTTTSPTNDKGVDVVGQIELGITAVREVIQVKRHRGSIGRPVLDQLRGSLHRFNAVRGTIITTGRFSKGAGDAAFESGAAPITLIDGEKLLDLLMDNEIGVNKKSVEYFEFAPDKLAHFDLADEEGST